MKYKEYRKAIITKKTSSKSKSSSYSGNIDFAKVNEKGSNHKTNAVNKYQSISNEFRGLYI